MTRDYRVVDCWVTYPTKDRAVSDIASQIELRHGHVRLHSVLGYYSPNEAEQEFLGSPKAT